MPEFSFRLPSQGASSGLPRILAALAALALVVLFFSVGAVLVVVLAAAGILLAGFHSLRRKLAGKNGMPASRNPAAGPRRPSGSSQRRAQPRSRTGEEEGVIEVEVVEDRSGPDSSR